MPFLRVIRDKRGYETTYLMDWYHESGRQRSRVLYAFRGPGGVRVGRVPLEPPTMHELEVRYPEVAFDWKAIFAERQVIESGPDLRRRRPRKEEAPAEPVALPKPTPKVQTQPAPHPAIPSVVQGDTPADRMAFLTEWYPKVRERVERRTTDPARRDALLTLAERLNPSAWDVSADLTEPLAHATEALERLARVLTRRRRRSGKRRAVPDDAGAVAANPSTETAAVEIANLQDELDTDESLDSADDEPES